MGFVSGAARGADGADNNNSRNNLFLSLPLFSIAAITRSVFLFLFAPFFGISDSSNDLF